MWNRASTRAVTLGAIVALAAVSAGCDSRPAPRETTGLAGGVGGSGGAPGPGGTGGGSATSATAAGSGGGAPMVACKPGDLPTILVVEKGSQQALAIDDAFVYFAPSSALGCDVESAIKRVPKVGGAVETVWPTVREIVAIAVDEQRVYWSDNPVSPCVWDEGPGYLLHAAPKAGGIPTVFPATGQGPSTFAITLDDTQVYWLDDAPNVQSVRSAPKGGGAPQLIYSANVSRSSLAVDESFVYAAGWGGLFSSGKSPGSPPSLLVGPPPPMQLSGFIGLALDATTLYWGGSRQDCGVGCAKGFIASMPKDQSGAPTELWVEEGWQPLALALQGNHLYWTQIKVGGGGKAEKGRVMRMRKDGTDRVLIASSSSPSRITVDDACVYWTDRVGGTIWKAPK